MRDIVLVTVDSLRADHVSWHGYDRGTTPNLGDRSERSIAFTSAFAHSCSTRPSFPSILTSSYALMYGGYEELADGRVTLAEALSDHGYATAGFHSNPYLNAEFGYDRGFDRFYDAREELSPTGRIRQAVKSRLNDEGAVYSLLKRAFDATEKRAGIELGSAYRDAREITDEALAWAKEARDAPRFLWVHYMDVHHPYIPPEKYQRRFRDEPVGDRRAVRLRRKMLESPAEVTDEDLETLIDLYDAEIAYVDAEVERLLQEIEETWGDDVIVAFTSDHGEEFRDHGGFSHRATFHDEVLHVPLLLNTMDATGSRDDLVGLLDLAPTLVDLADGTVPDAFEGQSLLDDERNRSSVIAEWSDVDTGERRFAIRTLNWKYIRDENGDEKLFSVEDDPDETVDVADSEPDVLADLRDRIQSHEATVNASEGDVGDVTMDDDVRQQLRDLGYQE